MELWREGYATLSGSYLSGRFSGGVAPGYQMPPLPGLTKLLRDLHPTAATVGHMITPLPWLRSCFTALG
jgi:hypothetical protein